MDSDGLPIVGPNVDFTKVIDLLLDEADILICQKKLLIAHAYDFGLISYMYSAKALDVLEVFRG